MSSVLKGILRIPLWIRAISTDSNSIWAVPFILGAAALFSALSGLTYLFDLNRAQGDDGRMVAALVELLFSILCVGLLLQVLSKKDSGAVTGVFLVALACLFILLAYVGTAGMLWAVTFPIAAIALLGRRAGYLSAASLGVALLGLFFLEGSSAPAWPVDFRTSLLVLYTVIPLGVDVLCCNSSRPCPNSFESTTGAISVVTDRASAQSMMPGGKKSQEESVRGILNVLSTEAKDIVVIYRRDAVDGLSSIPEPEAVFSYLLLAGIGAPGLLVSNSRGEAPVFHELGEFRASIFGMDDLLSKVETVINLRELKKTMEFNKIQGQIDTLKSHGMKLSSKERSRFERVCSDFNLSNREVSVARLILKGACNKEIGAELCISIETVKTHVKNLLKKCGIGSRIDLMRLFSED